jgi:hypothetical protein
MHAKNTKKICKIKKIKNMYLLSSNLLCLDMRGKNAFVSMAEMINSCFVYSSHISAYSLVSYLSFEFVGLHD